MPPTPILLRGGRCWDATRRTFDDGVDLLLADGEIAARGRDLPAPPGAAVLDCRGRWIIPGLIDCHVHLVSSGAADDLNVARNDPPPLRMLRMAEHARRTLAAGFTTVRDLGAPHQLNIHLARAVADGLVDGPRILAAGLGVTMTGGHGHGFIAVEADGPDEVRKAVRSQLKAGATAVKLFASGGVLTPGVDPRAPSFEEAELRAGVEEARKASLPVAAHAQAAASIANAVRAGVDSIEHGVWLDEQAIGLMLERGTCLVPTLTAPAVMVEHGASEGVAPYAIEKSAMVLDDHLASFRRALAAGVRVAMGTDQGTPLNRPGENAQEIVRMARHGLSAAAALLAATAWAADLLRVPAGRLAERLAADVVVLRRYPIEDITVLEDQDAMLAVIAGGRPAKVAPALHTEEQP
jgi:imidazolonepropionase-like amidohydrolase